MTCAALRVLVRKNTEQVLLLLLQLQKKSFIHGLDQ